jgi:OPT oligopeptide transporter protein
MGIYLPMSLTAMIAIGAVLGHIHDRWASRAPDPERAKRLGILMATGLIVGDSLWGVAYAGIVVASGASAPMAIVGAGFAVWANWIGALLFIAIVVWMYRSIRRGSHASPPGGNSADDAIRQ